MSAVSLFDGIGGFPEALRRAGVPTVATVEIDDAAAGVVADRFPGQTRFRDVTEVTGDDLRGAGFVPGGGGILTAGWPCQGNSVAGRRGGMDDPRSGLWRHVVRLLAETRPRWFIGENVPGLLSVNGGRDFLAVARDLDDLGYGVAWRVLDAQHFGVPQRRRRVFIVGCLGDGAAPAQVLLEPEGGGRDTAPSREAGADIAGTLGSRAGGSRTTDLDGHGAYIPVVGTLIAQSDGRGWRVGADEAADGQLIPFDAAQITSGDNRANPQDGDPAPTLADTGRPMVAETLRSHLRPGSNSSGALVAYALRADPGGTGQGHNVNYVTHALTSEGHDASEDGTGRGTPIVPMGHGATAVRRLTPLECERLQGYADGWTLTSNGKPQSDSARYRQLGNSVAVPCVEWIARRLVEVAS